MRTTCRIHPFQGLPGSVASIALLVLSCPIVAAERPNIILIFSDDHAYQAISAYDSRLMQTPNIDRLASEGIRFDKCYVTNSICGPSRACVLTGKYSHKNGYYINDQELDPRHITFPELLRDAGYQTALIGKWHLGRKSLPRGFDHWRILEHQGYYYQPKMVDHLGQTQQVGYVTDIIADETLHWLERGRDADRPFLLMMQHKAPHRPWDPGPRHLDQFQDTIFPEPATLFDDYQGRTSAARLAEMTIEKHLAVRGPDLKAWDDGQENRPRDWFYRKMTVAQRDAWLKVYEKKNAEFYSGRLSGKSLVKWKYQRLLQDYLACCSAMDESVGKVLDYLDETGLVKNTIVVYCSDQGFYLGEHGWFDKRFMYEQSLRTPLLIRWPAIIARGRVAPQIVSNVDLAQTFLEVAELPAAAGMQGRSIVPLLRGQSPADWRTSFYYHYYEGLEGGHHVSAHYGVTTGHHKLIHFYETGEWELYDLQSDPHELQSVFDQPAYADVQVTLLEELRRLRCELEVPTDDVVGAPSPN